MVPLNSVTLALQHDDMDMASMRPLLDELLRTKIGCQGQKLEAKQSDRQMSRLRTRYSEDLKWREGSNVCQLAVGLPETAKI